MKYLISVVMGLLIATLLVVLLPVIILLVLACGFLGMIKVNESEE